MFKWKDYGENTALFIDGINENVAILRHRDFQLTDSATGLKVKMKSSNIDEAKVDAENYLKELWRSEEHTSELQSRFDLVCRLLLEKKNKKKHIYV